MSGKRHRGTRSEIAGNAVRGARRPVAVGFRVIQIDDRGEGRIRIEDRDVGSKDARGAVDVHGRKERIRRRDRVRRGGTGPRRRAAKDQVRREEGFIGSSVLVDCRKEGGGKRKNAPASPGRLVVPGTSLTSWRARRSSWSWWSWWSWKPSPCHARGGARRARGRRLGGLFDDLRRLNLDFGLLLLGLVAGHERRCDGDEGEGGRELLHFGVLLAV